MMRYSVQPRDICKTFAKNMGKNISKNISKNLSGKYSQNLLHRAKQSTTDPLKTLSKRVIQVTADATGHLISNKIANHFSTFKLISL